MNIILLITLLRVCYACEKKQKVNSSLVVAKEIIEKPVSPAVIILGTVQDAGSPQIACKKECCRNLFTNPDKNRKVVSLGLIDPENNSRYLFEATPDLPEQLYLLDQFLPQNKRSTPDGIFLTHAHIGHYTGLMYFGKEAMNANKVPVFTMPKMNAFLKNNGPWNNLVSNENIILEKLTGDSTITLSKNLRITPHLVPHRDEYSETVGYTIEGPHKKALFIPDIDKWSKWDKNITEEIKKVDYAFIDATFFDGDEINNRDISEIPHPFVIESMKRFEKLSPSEKNKIIFIHFNHTNPLLDPNTQQSKQVEKNGFRIARINEEFKL